MSIAIGSHWKVERRQRRSLGQTSWTNGMNSQPAWYDRPRLSVTRKLNHYRSIFVCPFQLRYKRSKAKRLATKFKCDCWRVGTASHQYTSMMVNCGPGRLFRFGQRYVSFAQAPFHVYPSATRLYRCPILNIWQTLSRPYAPISRQAVNPPPPHLRPSAEPFQSTNSYQNRGT
jgi:hypothetical protein